MKTLIPAILILVALCAIPLGAQSHDLQTAGQVAVYSKPGTVAATTMTSWQPMPAMKGAVTLPRGGNLAATLSVDGLVSGGRDPELYVRMKVDGVVASPTQIRLLRGTLGRRTATVTFFKPGLASGPHKVDMEWSVTTGTTATVYARTLVMRFATADSPRLRLTQVQGSSVSELTGGWKTLPGMSTTLNVPFSSKLAITVTGEFLTFTNGKRAFLRAVVDNSVYQDTVIADGTAEGTRSYTVTTPALRSGNHSVRIEWTREDTAMVMFPLLTVSAVYEPINYKTGHLFQTYSGAAVANTSTAYSTLPDLGGNAWVPCFGDLSVRFTAEAGGDPNVVPVFRAVVNNQVASGTEVGFCTGETALKTQSREFVFVVRNVQRGWHNVRIDWRLLTSGGRAWVNDRNLTVTLISGQRPLLVTAMESTRPAGYKYGGTFSSSVVETRGSYRYFRPYVADNFFRTNPGVADWYLEQSRGHMFLVEAAVVGPGLKKYNEQYYREQVPDPFTAMKHEALQNADKSFDFSYYDRNSDGKITREELYAVVVLYQDWSWGEVRSLPAIASNDGVSLDYTGGIATVYTSDFKSRNDLGTFNHELAHLLLGAGDMYESSYDPTAPGPFSIMDQHGWNGHLDPLHKLKTGLWYEAWALTKDGYYTIPPVSRGGSLFKLYDTKSHSKEYFLVENRAGLGYNAALPARGLAVWHIDENRLNNWRTAVEIEPACGVQNPINYANYLFKGTQPAFHSDNDLHSDSTHTNTRWHDSQRSGIGVWAIERLNDGSNNMVAFMDLPGPGVLVQLDSNRYTVDATGSVQVQFRILNTDYTTDAFDVTVNVTGGYASWTSSRYGLAGYQQRLLTVTVTPYQSTASIAITAKGVTSGAQTVDSASVRMPLRALGAARPGAVVTLDCHNPPEAGHPYAMGASFGTSPGIPLGAAGTVPLNADTLFFSTQYLPGVFQKFLNILDGSGRGQSYVAIPNEKILIGLNLYCAYVTYTTAITDISNAVKLSIQ